MEMIYYVDSKEVLSEPKEGRQFIAWFNRSSQNNPGGVPHVDVINGEEVQLRSFDRDILEKFIRTAYERAPYIKVTEVFEHRGSDG